MQQVLSSRFGEQVEVVLHNLFFDRRSEVVDELETIKLYGLKLPVVFIDDEPVLVGKIDVQQVAEALIDRGLGKK